MNLQGKNKMAEMPVKSLLLNMGAPMMISMLGQAFYNVVDTFFVSHIPDTAQVADMGDKALNALTLAFPIQMLIMALGVGTGVGINAMIAKNLGRGDREQASRTAGNAIFVTLCYFVLIFLFGLTASEVFIHSQTADAVIAGMGTTYLRIITIFSFGTLGYMCLEKIVMGTGRTTITMVCQLAGAITNIILDPIMIYGLFGCPAMGVAGAAGATVIGQFVSLIGISVVYFKKDIGIDNSFRYLRPEKRALKNIYSIGLPAIVMQILTPIMSYALNLILGAISVSAVTAYGVYYKLQNFIFMPGYGLNNASIPIISYNYGAKDKDRVSQTIRYGLFYVSVIMLIGIVLLQLFARQIVGIFSVTEESHQLCVLALRIITCGFFFAGANIILQGVCQALGKGGYSLVISLLRFVVLALPLAWGFSMTANAATLVWLALPIAEAGACLTAFVFTKKTYQKSFAK
ncbi:MAG: MATE family efflux transporter [Lachnospiraceae bacterium]|nr:MATE family efflux transporter [Lachnospiraceae bacterium]